MSPTDDTRRCNNKRRVARMEAWIDLANERPATDDHAHVRFVFLWIAYEAAYQRYRKDGNSSDNDKWARKKFYCQVARRDGRRLRQILIEHREQVVKLLELRQAHHFFWYRPRKDDAWLRAREDSDAKWKTEFEKRVGPAMNRVKQVNRLDARQTADTLNDVFRNLAVVRNQIVHGGSAGRDSRGRTQVRLGATLLGALIPCFRDTIESNLEQDWGSPPFPRVGNRDERCSPPWLDAR